MLCAISEKQLAIEGMAIPVLAAGEVPPEIFGAQQVSGACGCNRAWPQAASEAFAGYA
jgi:hypothetical protein